MEHDLLVGYRSRIQIQRIGSIEVIILGGRFGSSRWFIDANRSQGFISLKTTSVLHCTDLNQTFGSICYTIRFLIMITRTHFEFERTIVRYAYAREDDITAVVTLLGEHEQSAVLGTAVANRIGYILAAVRIVDEGLRLSTKAVSTYRQSRMHIVIIALRIHTAYPGLLCLAAHVLKSEEVLLFVVVLGIHLERITRPSTDILIAAQRACKDAIRGSSCQIREYHMRRIYHDTFRVIQIGRNIANERIFRFRNDNKLPTRIGLAGRRKSNLNGVIRSTDRFQLRCITGSHKFEGDIIQPIIVFSRRNIRDTGGKHEIIIRQFILAQIHLATREGCTGGQVEGLQ